MSLNLPASTQAPTIGRKVWFWLGADEIDSATTYNDQAIDATVIYVNEDGTVDLHCIDHEGESFVRVNTALFDYDEAVRHGMEFADQSFATWMPYQMKKHKEEAAQTPAAIASQPHNVGVANAINAWAAGGVDPAPLTLTDGKDV